MKKISFAGPSITKKEIEYVVDGVKNGFYDNYSKHTKLLEKTVREYIGVKYAIATHCCTLALHLATLSLDLKKGDEVICTDISWVATAAPILYVGATPVFVDIDPVTWCISPEAIEKAITKKTKAIMLVHTFGQPAEMDKIMKIARKYKLKIIEDAAPALGAEYKGKRVGSFGDVACFSFQGAKVTVSGEGGIFLTNDKKIYEKALLFAGMGRTDSKMLYWCDTLGYQYTIANLSAALALAQVERVEELVQKKRDIFSWYEEGLKDVPGIILVKERKDTKSNYCYPSFLFDESITVNREVFLSKLKEKNIHARPAHPRMSNFPFFTARFKNPVATLVQERGVSLPSAANITKTDIAFVCKTIKAILKQ